MQFRLFVGGMENSSKDSALSIMFTDEADLEALPSFPKILYCMNIPLIWFWGELYDENESPELPLAFNTDYFKIVYDYTIEEIMEVISNINKMR